MRRARSLLIVVVLAVASAACPGSTPRPKVTPSISPRQQQLFQKDELVRNLERLRVSATAASDREFPLVADTVTREVLLFIRSMNSMLEGEELFGWQDVMRAWLDKLTGWLHANSVVLFDEHLTSIRMSIAGATPR